MAALSGFRLSSFSLLPKKHTRQISDICLLLSLFCLSFEFSFEHNVSEKALITNQLTHAGMSQIYDTQVHMHIAHTPAYILHAHAVHTLQ